jgi:hypothetical protein
VALPQRAELERQWRAVHTVWLCVCAFAVLVWAGLPLLLRGGGSGSGFLPQFLWPILLAVAVFDLAVGYWLKHQALAGRLPIASSGASGPTRTGGLVGPSVAAVAMAATPVVLGIVTYVLGAGLNVLSGFCALALIGLLFLRPNLEEWEEAMMRGAGEDAGRRSRG